MRCRRRVASGCGGHYLITRVRGATICQKFLDNAHLALDSSSQEGLWLHGTILAARQAQGWAIPGVQEREQHRRGPALFPWGSPQLAG